MNHGMWNVSIQEIIDLDEAASYYIKLEISHPRIDNSKRVFSFMIDRESWYVNVIFPDGTHFTVNKLTSDNVSSPKNLLKYLMKMIADYNGFDNLSNTKNPNK
jgi:hypothetical protein